MRLPSFFTRSNHRIIAVLLTAAAVTATSRAHLSAEPPGEMAFRRTITNSEEVSANQIWDDPIDAAQESMVEATTEDPNMPGLEGPIFERPKLTGDWLGRRSCLRENGITIDISSTQYYQGVVRGGLDQAFNYGGRDDYFLNLDGEKLGLWQGASATLHGETRYGESVSSLAGTLSAPNLLLTLPQPNGSITALTGVTFTQSLSEELLVYFGKLNTLDEFRQPLTGAGNLSGFQNTAMLYNPVLARTVPYSTFGAGFSCLQNGEQVFSACVYDTNDTPTVLGFDTFFDNGATVYAELGLASSFFDLPGNHGLAGSYSSGKYTDLTPSAYLDPIEGLVVASPPIAGSWCLAYNFDQALYVSPEAPERMWGVFGNFGISDNNPSPIRWFASTGVSGASLIAGREADSFGIAYFYLGASQSLKELAPLLLPLRDEHGVEVYYNTAVTPWCQVTPDLQVITPLRERADTALLLGLRAHVSF